MTQKQFNNIHAELYDVSYVSDSAYPDEETPLDHGIVPTVVPNGTSQMDTYQKTNNPVWPWIVLIFGIAVFAIIVYCLDVYAKRRKYRIEDERRLRKQLGIGSFNVQPPSHSSSLYTSGRPAVATHLSYPISEYEPASRGSFPYSDDTSTYPYLREDEPVDETANEVTVSDAVHTSPYDHPSELDSIDTSCDTELLYNSIASSSYNSSSDAKGSLGTIGRFPADLGFA
jgi:hypothetical protein